MPNRYYHGCGLLRNNILGAEFAYDIVVSGGLSKSDQNEPGIPLQSVEIYDSTEHAWKNGPDLPNGPLYGHVVVQYSSDKILSIGGHGQSTFSANRNIYSLSKSGNSIEAKAPQSKKLKKFNDQIFV